MLNTRLERHLSNEAFNSLNSVQLFLQSRSCPISHTVNTLAAHHGSARFFRIYVHFTLSHLTLTSVSLYLLAQKFTRPSVRSAREHKNMRSRSAVTC
jgi:hypothetical protein